MPKYIVWCPDDGEERDSGARAIEACNVYAACEEWAERDDCESAEYWLAHGNDKTVFAEDEGGKLHQIIVSGETVPSYSARLIVTPNKNSPAESAD